MAMFSKVLQCPDIERGLSVPEACIKAFQPTDKGTEMNLQVRDESGIVRTFRCRIPIGLNPKPVVFGDWLQFVRSKDLKQGDAITFYKEKDHATGADYRITVKKRESYYSRFKTSIHPRDITAQPV
ncbi:conserved hypothetical protein [Ricinus communis]|uniref:TF-B3 domain-containing protein n=1 Tax=Ricinus communis TaxID=3988 RepID=B9T462_RICCO|nr:conserved hypothetical protein [Ricinus communis]